MERKLENISDGFLYGYGLFETVKIENNHPKNLEKHFERLASSCKTLNMNMDFDYEKFQNIFLDEIEKNKTEKNKTEKNEMESFSEENYILRISFVKDGDSTKYFFNKRKNPYDLKSYENGFKLTISQVRRDSNSILVYHKTLNYMENLLSLSAAKSKNFNEILFFNEKNYLCEGAVSNVFLMKNGIVYTPKVGNGLLKGVMRDEVIKRLNDQGIEVVEDNINMQFLLDSDGVFITNSILGIMKVIQIDDKKYSGKLVEELKAKLKL